MHNYYDPPPGATVLMRAPEGFTDTMVVNGKRYELRNRLVEVDPAHVKYLWAWGFSRVS